MIGNGTFEARGGIALYAVGITTINGGYTSVTDNSSITESANMFKCLTWTHGKQNLLFIV